MKRDNIGHVLRGAAYVLRVREEERRRRALADAKRRVAEDPQAALQDDRGSWARTVRPALHLEEEKREVRRPAGGEFGTPDEPSVDSNDRLVHAEVAQEGESWVRERRPLPPGLAEEERRLTERDPLQVRAAGAEDRRSADGGRHRGWILGGAVALSVAIVGVIVGLPTYDAPWTVQSTEWGNRALAMDTFTSARTRSNPVNKPSPVLPAVAASGTTAGEAYQNVQVLGDLDKAEFDRTMQAITAWVSPDEGCSHCHAGDDYAAEGPYTKDVARAMLKMVRGVNAGGTHVAPSGVTCYTCHRGETVPANSWTNQPEHDPGPDWLGPPQPWQDQATTIRKFFPNAPFEWYIGGDKKIAGLQARTPLAGDEKMVFEDGDHTYILMMQWSDALGVNCTYCHNSRAFFDWTQGTPKHAEGYTGRVLTHGLITNVFDPLAKLLPKERLGPLGDAFKPDCKTCHTGLPKPVGGQKLAAQYPGLVGAPTEAFIPDVPTVRVPLAKGGWAPTTASAPTAREVAR
ncbi:photosynthetic reaction center cytochrome PufC [Acuticoccus sp. MNP-M23]|uniref:photosynthetic reaction center cytochrome PufC n=1 Tax=Acuticoccus sp. MNP-M23 TaxID=3072793 RepID=UPI0028155972|nr:photosynthetic reaction center cytochrome PufC [Acuticoccus sp. MNP-M23]WMS41907.1 photosynthetic reaction center cytochrome PufC [Acuticoccus sp. MNP-M23]